MAQFVLYLIWQRTCMVEFIRINISSYDLFLLHVSFQHATYMQFILLIQLSDVVNIIVFFSFFGMLFESVDLRRIRSKAQCIIRASGKNSNHAYQCKWMTFSSNIYRDVISLNHNKLLNAIYFLTDPKIRYSADKRPSYCW